LNNKERRPTHPADERSLVKAEKWRNQVIREIAKKVTQIQNGKLRI
jgi:pre-mRNA-splicing factor ISY1